MALIKSFSSFQNLSNFTTFVRDTNPNSDFFRITEFKETFTGGKNGFLIEGSEFLKETTEVKIEILDVEGNPIYYEPGKGSPDYYEGLSTLVSVHIYPDTPIGIGKITILGELKQYIDSNGTLRDVPEDWKGVYNVKWERTFKINRNLSNEDIVRFYRRPTIAISELVKPIFSKTVPSITQNGSLEGVAIQPSVGSDLTNWRAGTIYKLKITDGSNWTSSVDENIISIPSLGYSPVVKEVLNNKEVLVDIPYSVNNIVQNFTTSPYETTFEYIEGQSVTESALTGSFARINISNLKTFVGDVARVKVFRKSRNEVTDFQFVQESKLESSELLRDVTVSNDTEISYGNFSDSNLSTYWVSSSDDHPLSVNVDVLQSSIKTDYNSTLGGVQHLITSESFSISKDVEYTLTFKTLISGSLNGSEYLRGYLSSSDGYQQTFLTVSGSDIYKTRQIVSQNIIANPISASNAHLVFEISGSDWYISNVSLKNAQETSFSPDEFLLIQEIPRKLASETFDFRFEFYDINNNYIPVDVLASATFDGGNDFPTSGKLLTFESDRNAFRFSTGSIQNPENQVVKFTLTQNNLVGTPTFASAAYDVDGNYLNPSNYSQYPGLLTSVTPAGGLLTINNFTGSYSGTPPTPFVGSIVYTASLDGLEEYETVYRLEDGENAPTLIVTSDANQFIYEPTTLSPKPSGQSITIRAQRKNLASYNTPITVNSGSGYPPLNFVETTTNGVTTYTISATEFSASFAANNFDSVKYSFTGSDVYDNQYSDEVTISKVVNFDGVSLVLSNESTTFPAKSTGEVVGGFAASSGSVQMFIGGNQIQHDDASSGRLKNTFDITSVVGSGVTPTSTSPTNQYYSISAMSADSGSLTLNIEYLAGDNSTSQSFEKIVSYTKAKKAVPTVLTKTSPTTQTINSSSAGFETPQVVEVVLQEGGDEYTYNSSVSSPQTFRINGLGYSAGSASFSNEIITLFPSSSLGGIITSGIIGSASVDYRDSEGTLVQNKLVRFDLSVSKIGVDGINGSAGSGSYTVSLTANKYAVSYDQFGNLAPAGQTIDLTANASLAFDTPHFEFVSGSTTVQPYSTTNTYSVSPLPTPGQTILYQVNVKEGGTGDVLAFDNIDVFGLQSGSDAFTIFLTNEAHTFAANSDGVITSTLEDGATEIRFFRGTQQYTYATSGLNTYSVSATSSSVELLQSTVSSQRKFTPTSVSGDAGTATITITDNNTSQQFVKTYTFTRSKKGAPVATILANPQSQTVTSGSAGIGTPTNVSIIVNEGGSNYTYATSGPSTFNITSVTGGTHSGTNTFITPTQPSNSTPINGVVTLNYRNSEGTLFSGKTVNFNVGVAGIGNSGADGAKGDPGDPGGDGPGVVFRGPWSSTTTYYDTDDYPTRRDAVLYNGTYYATKTNPTTNLNKQPDTETTFWESLGTDSYFVAAEIAIFKESYVKNTINVGTNTSGNANITIAGGTTSPYISVGQATKGYNQTGAWIGSDGTSGKLSLKSASNSLLWDGTSLTINGGGTFTGTLSAGTLSSPVGNIGGFTIGSSQLYTGTKSTFASAAAGVYLGNDGIALGTNSPFKVTSAGVLTATGANISGTITIGTTTLTEANTLNENTTATQVGLGNVQNLNAQNQAQTGLIAGTTITGGGITLSNGGNIKGGQTDYNTGTGFFLGYSGSAYKFSIGNGSTKGITWDGSTMTVAGDVRIGNTIASTVEGNANSAIKNNDTGTNVGIDGGSVGGWTIGTPNLYSGAGSATGAGITLNSGGTINVRDTSGLTKLQLRTGALSALSGGSSISIPSMATPTSWTSAPTTSTNGEWLVGSTYTLNGGAAVSSGIWSGAISTGGSAQRSFSTTSSFSGYAAIELWVQFANNTGFSGATNVRIARTSTNSPSTILTLSSGTALFLIDVPSSSVYYARIAWVRVVQGNPNYTTDWSYNPSATTNSTVAEKGTPITEITDYGLQIINSPSYYLKCQRESYSTATPFFQIGGDISATGNITAYYSDKRLKNILGNIDNPLEKINKLNGVYYTKNQLARELGMETERNFGRTEVGLIAQEVEEVLPEIVHLAPIDMDTDTGKSKSGENYLTIDYDKVVPLLVESVKELSKKIEKLEEENKILRDGKN